MKLRDILNHKVSTFDGVCWRFGLLDYAWKDDFANGVGSLLRGGRYNFKGAFRCLYLALDEETALAELKHGWRAAGIDDYTLRCHVFVGIGVRLSRVLDLTNDATLNALGLKNADLMADWRADQRAGRESLTQALGREARDAGFEALLVPSARLAGGRNLVLFVDRLAEGCIELPPLLDEYLDRSG